MKSKHVKKKISVMVPVFNQECYVGRCLRSLLDQSLLPSNYEIIVVDDGSTDKTPYALDLFSSPFDDRVIVLTNEENMGLPYSINRALAHSNASFVVRVDADDFVNRRFLDFLLGYAELNDGCKAVACDYLLVDDTETVIERKDCVRYPIGCGILFETEVLKSLGGYDETFLCHEDKELRIRYEKKHTVQHLDVPLYRYRRHSNNMTSDEITMSAYQERLQAKHGLG